MSAMITTAINGSRLLKACNFDRHLFATLVSERGDWREILDSLPPGPLRRNAAGAVFEIRIALGLEADHALDICQGTE
jgi:hypothetical protein